MQVIDDAKFNDRANTGSDTPSRFRVVGSGDGHVTTSGNGQTLNGLAGNQAAVRSRCRMKKEPHQTRAFAHSWVSEEITVFPPARANCMGYGQKCHISTARYIKQAKEIGSGMPCEKYKRNDSGVVAVGRSHPCLLENGRTNLDQSTRLWISTDRCRPPILRERLEHIPLPSQVVHP